MKSTRINSRLIDTMKRFKDSRRRCTHPPQPPTSTTTRLRLKTEEMISKVSKTGTRVTTLSFSILTKQTMNTLESKLKSRKRSKEKCSRRTQERSLIFNRTEINLHNCKENCKKLEDSTSSTIQLMIKGIIQILHTNNQQTGLKKRQRRWNGTSMTWMLKSSRSRETSQMLKDSRRLYLKQNKQSEISLKWTCNQPEITSNISPTLTTIKKQLSRNKNYIQTSTQNISNK